MSLDIDLRVMRAAHEATARYRVYRDENRTKTVLDPGPLTLAEAREVQRTLTAALEAEPGYRPVMSRALIGIELIIGCPF